MLYYIGTGGSTAPYKNPHLTGQVTASMSSLFKVCIVYVCDCVSGGGCVGGGGGGLCMCDCMYVCVCVLVCIIEITLVSLLNITI